VCLKFKESFYKMHDVITFFMDHWLLATTFIVVLLLLAGNEFFSQLIGGRKCVPSNVAYLTNKEGGTLIDLRNKTEYQQGYIASAVNAPFAELTAFFSKTKLAKDKPIILVDAQGAQSQKASALFRKQGFTQVYFLAGGIAAWRQESYPLVKK
jgi:rhodanese-related sulfurtransferase